MKDAKERMVGGKGFGIHTANPPPPAYPLRAWSSRGTAGAQARQLEEAAGLLDSYLTAERKRAEEKARKAGGELTGAQSGAQEPEIAANPHG